MTLRMFIASAATAAVSLAGVATAAPSSAAGAHAAMNALGGRCTLTSTHHCIRGGEFCPRASYGRSGWDAVGRRYVCKGSHTHPHWMRP